MLVHILVFKYIYILDSHVAPYGACEVAQSTARSNTYTYSSKQSDFEKDCEGKSKVFSNTMRLARAAISSAKWLRSTPSRAFERPGSAEHSRAVLWSVAAHGLHFREYEGACSSNVERQVASKHARPMISSAWWLPSTSER